MSVVSVAMIHRWIRQERGASSIEYAMMLALIAAVGLIAFDGAGRTLQAAFRGVTRGIGPVEEPLAVAATSLTHVPAVATHRVTWSDPRSWREPLALATIICVSISLVVCRRSNRIAEAVPEPQAEGNPAEPTSPLFDKRQKMFRFLSTNTQAIFHSQLEVRHVMTTNVKTVLATTPRAEVQALLTERKIHHALVCDEHERFVGVISDRDVLSRNGRTARDLMTPNPHHVTPDTPLNAALTLMLNHRISCVPVVDGDRLRGVYTTTDVILALQCTMQALERVSMIGRGDTDPEVELECTLQMLSKLVDQPVEA